VSLRNQIGDSNEICRHALSTHESTSVGSAAETTLVVGIERNSVLSEPLCGPEMIERAGIVIVPMDADDNYARIMCFPHTQGEACTIIHHGIPRL
jgi:hypothetical protein